MIDARGLHVFPGAADSHFHVGIYRPHWEDARSESLAAVSGGVTTLISYFRTGHHYLNKSGSYRDLFPEVLDLSRGNFHCDFRHGHGPDWVHTHDHSGPHSHEPEHGTHHHDSGHTHRKHAGPTGRSKR